MTRLGSVCVAFAGVLVLASAAHAEGMLPNGAEVTFERFFIFEDGEFKEPSTEDAARQYLNFAHCACSKAGAGEQTTFQYEVKLSLETGLSRPGDVWVGAGCYDAEMRPMNCRQLTDQTIADIDTLAATPATIEVGIYDAIHALEMPAACKEAEGTATVWVLVDTDGDTTYDYGKSTPVGNTATSMAVGTYDTQAPPLPTAIDASSGEGAIEITWDAPTGRADDIYAFQALCMDASGAPVQGVEVPDQRYQRTDDVCALVQPFELMASPVESPDGTDVATLPEPFRALDPAYLCADQPLATATSLTINGLENDQPYTVALLAVDRAGNVVGTYFNRTLVPKPVVDLWEDLQDRHSPVEGGCLLATTYGEGNPLTTSLRAFRDRTLARTAFGRALTRAYYATIGKLGPAVEGSLALRVIAAIALAPFVVLALLWHVLTLPGVLLLLALPWLWRRRRQLRRLGLHRWLRRLAPAAVALAILGPVSAHADDFIPYWEADGATEDALTADFGEVKWHAGIRVGAYIPEIDLQAGLNAITGKGPYEAMFGDYYLDGEKHSRAVWQILPMLDVDYILWGGFGQIGVGGSLGYMQKSAYAYKDGTNEDQPMRERSTASRNTFRLIPMAATVTYRFTVLDELWGIPVVPYVRGGLSYYAWWIKAPNGNYSRYCEESAGTMCTNENLARGGSLGYQGSIGLAIRAERIDTDAAMSMRNSGILHAGFYGEFQYAKVDGFGSETKLSVGDNTWFAGVNFEF